MDRRPFSSRWSPLLVLAVLAGVPSVHAEPPATNAWKPIIFSTPDNGGVSSNVTSLSTQPVPPANFQNLFQDTTPAPSFNFGPAPMPNTGRRLLKKSGDDADWVFQTPAEIMGVVPEQNSSTGKRNRDGQPDNLTPLERYLEGQSMNPRSKVNSSRSQNFWGDENGRTNSDNNSPDLINSGLDDLQSPATASQPLNAAPNTVLANNLFASPDQDSVWPTVLGTPAPQPTANPVNPVQQQADMDQFQHMLNPGFVPVTAATTAPDGTTSFKSQITLPASDSTQPLVNPIGASFAPLTSGIGQPAPMAQLPGVTHQVDTQSSLTPAWAPQPAPWTSPNPQPFGIPQRKF